jgi:hypothetical protein
MFYPFGVPGETVDHRVDRLLLSFFSSRRNWDIPTPSPAGECLPPLVAKKRGGGVSLFGKRGQTLWYSGYKCTVFPGPRTAVLRSDAMKSYLRLTQNLENDS